MISLQRPGKRTAILATVSLAMVACYLAAFYSLRRHGTISFFTGQSSIRVYYFAESSTANTAWLTFFTPIVMLDCAAGAEVLTDELTAEEARKAQAQPRTRFYLTTVTDLTNMATMHAQSTTANN